MGMRGINHVVLYVADLQRSLDFYEQVLGFERLAAGEFPGGVFLRHAGSANDHDLGLFQARGRETVVPGRVGLYHVAWEVETLADLEDMRQRLVAVGALGGAADHAATKALYGRDPDGIEFEICWLVPDGRLEEALYPGVALVGPLDIPREIARYGASTPGGPRTDFAVWKRLAAESSTTS